MRYESINAQTALERLDSGEVYYLIKMSENDTLGVLRSACAEGRVVTSYAEWQPKPTTEPVAGKPKATPERKASAIDHGRIVALFKAGWSVPKIADDVGCSLPTVRAHLTQEGLWSKKEGADNGKAE